MYIVSRCDLQVEVETCISFFGQGFNFDASLKLLQAR